MKELYIKQKVMTLGERFSVIDEEENELYRISGSFMKLPKTFSIFNISDEEIALITKKSFTFFNHIFEVSSNGQHLLTIEKKFSFLKAKYSIDSVNIDVEGDVLDLNFRILYKGKLAGEVKKAFLSWGDSYKVLIKDESLEGIVIAIVVAIDCVQAYQNSS